MQKSISPPQLQDFGNRPLSFEEAKTLLLSDEKKISNVAAVKPQGGYGYFFQGPTLRAKNDFVCDQYRFYSDGRHVKNGVLKRYYKIKVPGIQKKVVSSEFQRHVYTLYNVYKTEEESPICLVHYVGNSSCYLDSKHGNAKKKQVTIYQQRKLLWKILKVKWKEKSQKWCMKQCM